MKKLAEVLALLEEKGEVSLEAYRQDTELQWIVERGLELGASMILDIGNHILAGAYQVSADEYEQIIAKLGEKGVISRELYQDLRGLGGFRNLLVHGYLQLNPEVVYAHFHKALRVFPRFIAEIEHWLEASSQ